MSSWLMRPERIPSYFAQDSEPEAATAGRGRLPQAAPVGRALVQVLRHFAHAKQVARSRSAAAW